VKVMQSGSGGVTIATTALRNAVRARKGCVSLTGFLFCTGECCRGHWSTTRWSVDWDFALISRLLKNYSDRHRPTPGEDSVVRNEVVTPSFCRVLTGIGLRGYRAPLASAGTPLNDPGILFKEPEPLLS